MGLEEISDVGDFTVILDCQQFFLDKSQLFSQILCFTSKSTLALTAAERWKF